MADPHPEIQLLELAEAQFGLLTSRQLRELGFGTHAFDDRVGGRHWERITDEVLRRAGAPSGRGTAVLAPVLDAGPGAVLSHSSAAAWWGVKACDPDPVHVTRTSRSVRRPHGARLHTVRDLPTAWVTTLDFVPIVRPELLALQLFAQFSFDKAERRVDTMWSLRLLSGPSMIGFLDQFGARGRNGCTPFRRYLEVRGPGYVPPSSGLESRARSILKSAGLAFRVEVHTGGASWVGRVDLRHDDLPVILEVQSERYHAALCNRRDDAVRVEALEDAGFVVAEVWDSQVWDRPWEVVRSAQTAIRVARSRAASDPASVPRN